MGNLINPEGATPIGGFLGFFGGGKETDRIQLSNKDNKTTLVACKRLDDAKGFSSFKAQKRQTSLGFFQRHVTVKTGENSYIDINIRSCAKRLGISNEQVLNLAKASESLNFFLSNSQVPPSSQPQTQNAQLLQMETAENLPQGIKASDFAFIQRIAPNLNGDELQKILKYVQDNKAEIISELNRHNLFDSKYVRPSESNLARAIQFNKDGTVLIHFNRCKSLGDKILGEGGNKVVKFAWDVTNNNPLAVARIPDQTSIHQTRIGKAVEDEFQIWDSLKIKEKIYDATGKKIGSKEVTAEGIAELRQFTSVPGKKGLTKHLFIQPIYNQGDLGSFIEKNSLPMETKKSMARQMLRSCSLLNEQDIVHMDIKPENFLVSKTEKTDTQPQSIKVVLADFGTSTVKNNFTGLRGTLSYMPPEYLNESLYNQSLKVSEKNDSWALGVTLFELFTGKEPSWFDNQSFPYGLKQEEVDRQLKKIPEELRPLLSDLLKVDPEKRLTVQEAQKRHGGLLQDRVE